jgi:ABC-type multidrug transport system ATPase subunit
MSGSSLVLQMLEVACVVGGARVIDRVNLSLDAGERVAIVGRNGSGKSTLARLATGLILPATGRVELFGADTRTIAPGALRRLRGRIGVVLQGGSLLGELSVEDNLLLGLGLRGAASIRRQRARIDRALFDFRLETIGGRIVGELTQGEQRRVELARALLRDPDLLVLDDPFEGVDEASIAEMMAHTVRSIARRRRAVLLLTREEALAERLASRVLTLEGGRLYQQDGAELAPADRS